MATIKIGELLKKFGYITDKQIEVAEKVKKIYPGKLFGEILKELYFVSSAEVSKAISLQSGRPYINLDEIYPSKDALKSIDKDIATKYRFLPISIDNEKISIAIDDPYNIVAIDMIKRLTGRDVEVFVAEEEKILRLIHIHYYLLENPFNQRFNSLINRINKEGVTNVIPEIIDFVLTEALIERASDIHISPQHITTDIFFRIDGVMNHFVSFPKEIHSSMVSKIKVMSNLDIAEQRLPQDGSFSYRFMGENYDFRVSTLPSVFGENIVLRVLPKNISLFSIHNLGFRDFQLNTILKIIRKSQGIFLITGPTGSGKTTTLYSILRKINALERNIITVEDPVEYRFPFIKQTQINDKIGYTFSSAARAFLRQDPDVMLIGEIRDEETAEIAVKAAITGHLVLSTLHTNSSVTAIPRLLDLKILPYMLASSLVAVSAQRLVRKLCPFCKEKTIYHKEDLLKLGFSVRSLEKTGIGNYIEGYRAAGCEKCAGSGYSGRKLIAEIFEVDREISQMIEEEVAIAKILEKLEEKGMKTMEDIGLLDVIDGITTPEEIMRVAG